MMYRNTMLVAILGAFSLLGTACEQQDPCRFLPPPSAAEQAAAASGAEVERPGEGDAECLVNGNVWTAEPREKGQ